MPLTRLVRLRRQFLEPGDAAQSAAAAQRPRSSGLGDEWERQQRELGRQRRQREEERRKLVQRWFIAQYVTFDAERLAVVHVPVPPAFIVGGAQRGTEPVSVPTRAGSVWRPRVSSLLFAPPYIALLRSTVFGLRGGCADADAPLALMQDETAVAQSIQRMLIIIYLAQATIAQSGKRSAAEALGVVGVLQTTRSSAPVGRESLSRSERIAEERRDMQRVLEQLRRVPYGFPGAVCPAAQSAMLDAYVSARLVASQRSSMVSLLAMRITCVLYVMVPHLLPIAPDGLSATVLARVADTRWRAENPAVDAAIRRNSDALAQRSTGHSA